MMFPLIICLKHCVFFSVSASIKQFGLTTQFFLYKKEKCKNLTNIDQRKEEQYYEAKRSSLLCRQKGACRSFSKLLFQQILSRSLLRLSMDQPLAFDSVQEVKPNEFVYDVCLSTLKFSGFGLVI